MMTANRARLSRGVVAPAPYRVVINRRLCALVSASARTASSSTSKATTALSITASAAASALLAKVAALLAAGGALPAALHHLSSSAYKDSEKEYHSSSAFQGALAGKVAVASAPAPAALAAASAVSFPAEWLFVTSAAEWLDQHREAAAAGALLATVFISDAAALAHAPLLERLRRNFGTGSDAPVRFVFVRIEEDYARRQRACAACATASAISRGGPGGLTLGRVSHTAALHGLDAALTSFLPDGVRAFPSLMLTAGPGAAAVGNGGGTAGAAADAAEPWSWSAATRVGELTQLVSDWAFIVDRRRRQAEQSSQTEQLKEGEELAAEGGPVRRGDAPARRVAAPPKVLVNA